MVYTDGEVGRMKTESPSKTIGTALIDKNTAEFIHPQAQLLVKLL